MLGLAIYGYGITDQAGDMDVWHQQIKQQQHQVTIKNISIFLLHILNKYLVKNFNISK